MGLALDVLGGDTSGRTVPRAQLLHTGEPGVPEACQQQDSGGESRGGALYGTLGTCSNEILRRIAVGFGDSRVPAVVWHQCDLQLRTGNLRRRRL